ncbi:MAG: VWA domain-containing protein [Pseudomonadota bacterium]
MTGTAALAGFVSALRSADVSVSPAEAIDAAGALAVVGYTDKGLVKSALRPALCKSTEDGAVFDRLFELYFSRAAFSSTGDAAPGEADGAPAEGDLLALVNSGDEAALATALERAGEAARVKDIRFSTQTAFYAQKMLKALGVEAMEADLLEALQARTPEGEARAKEIIDARRAVLKRAREYTERQYEVFGSGRTQTFREEILAGKSISSLDRADYARMRPLVEKMAKRLSAKYGRRRKMKTGALDVRRTVRANAGLGGVPFNVHWKKRARDRAKLVVLCDVSGSVAQYVRFLLLLLHCLGETVEDLRAFAFSGHLGEITDDLNTDGFEGAVEQILRRYGMGSTDYGQALQGLEANHSSAIDRQTSFIVLGDGRSNYGDPCTDIFSRLAARAKQTIWLCPEPPALWGSGDSEMPSYRPYCVVVANVSSLTDLERALDRILARYGVA